ncbi:hypothetical protein JN12_00089 [Geobacter argillaceus]|uniref:Uncharacterized protein n=2 Tax=Geobacter argillaceus TaxID=345631 RepID=A0A562WS54_9BACT|nr:hypothetical protein JN12_00089 [Geobacter argillaceus]
MFIGFLQQEQTANLLLKHPFPKESQYATEELVHVNTIYWPGNRHLPSNRWVARNYHMGMVPIDTLETGMVLATDVQDSTGRLLLGSGVELTQKHLVIFRTWGVEEADIAGIDDVDRSVPLPPEVTQSQLEETEQSLTSLFRHANTNHPAIRELLRLAAISKILHGHH